VAGPARGPGQRQCHARRGGRRRHAAGRDRFADGISAEKRLLPGGWRPPPSSGPECGEVLASLGAPRRPARAGAVARLARARPTEGPTYGTSPPSTSNATTPSRPTPRRRPSPPVSSPSATCAMPAAPLTTTCSPPQPTWTA
jgi:hypothetical protein